jgi:uncharacterized protein
VSTATTGNVPAWILRQPHRIRRLRLYLTTSCPFRCRYCYVRKTDQDLSWDDARGAVELLLRAPGRRKTLLVLGGEPLLRPDLLLDVVRHADGLARRLRKELLVSVATNAWPYRPEIGRRLAVLPVRLAVSIDGPARVHDRFRRTAGGRATYRRVAAHARGILRDFGSDRVCALMGVHPEFAGRAAEAFARLVDLGFRTVNLEPIHGVPWPHEATAAFAAAVERIRARVLGTVAGGAPLFLGSVNRELQAWDLTRQRLPNCPVEGRLEVHPGGLLFFSAVLANARARRRWLAGTMRQGLRAPYASCRFAPADPRCASCWSGHLGPSAPRETLRCPGQEVRDRLSIATARQILDRGRVDARRRAYVARARALVFE